MYIFYHDQIMLREELHIDPEDRGYQFGDGIYEVIRFYQREPFELEAHLKRLARSAKEISLRLPPSFRAMTHHLRQLIAAEEMDDGIVYIQVTRGVAPRTHQFPADAEPVLIAYATPMQRPLQALKRGIKVVTVEDIRWLRVDIKSINLLGNVLAKQQAADAGADEAIQVRAQKVTEGSSTNFFGIRGDTCYTHPANHLILNGITRQVVLRLLPAVGLRLQELPIDDAALPAMDELFVTSTTMEICPVVEVNRQAVGTGEPGPYTRQLQKAFTSLIPPLSTPR